MKTIIFLGILVALTANAQTDPPKFEVASFKLVTGLLPKIQGGPGSFSPGKFTAIANLKTLIKKAWGVSDFQIVGAEINPNLYYEVIANVPAGATPETFGVMLQNLLADRLGLQTSRESRQQQAYELVVAAQGPKLQKHPDKAEEDKVEPPVSSPHTFGLTMETSTRPGLVKFGGKNKELSVLAAFLESILRQSVLEKTGLVGKYDFALEFDGKSLIPEQNVGNEVFAGRTIFQALVDLGLKLQQTKAEVPVIVVKKFHETPTEN